jgi:hypothetical protein
MKIAMRLWRNHDNNEEIFGQRPPRSAQIVQRRLTYVESKNIRTQRPCRKLDHILHGPFKIPEVITDTAICLNLTMKWKIHIVFHLSLLDPFVQGCLEVNLEKVLDAADPIEADNEYDVEEVMGSLEQNSKVTYLVSWKWFLAKKDWTGEIYERFYSVRAKEELRKFHSKNPESRRDPGFKIKM